MEHLYKLIFRRDHQGFSANEGAAFSFADAVRLVGSGVCVIDPSETEREALEAAVKGYRKPALDPLWLLPCVSKRWPGWYR
jgi:hypothetical protein